MDVCGGGCRRCRYLIVRPENGGIRDLLRYSVWADRDCEVKFVETAVYDDDEDGGDREEPESLPPERGHRLVIIVSIVVRKIITFFGKPLEWIGYLVEFLLNLLSLNDNLFGLFYNIIRVKVVVPQRGSENFISAIGHLDGRTDLYRGITFKENQDVGETSFRGINLRFEPGNRALMDLCIMASKLAYENVNVVRNVVNLHWKMHFVDFYDCWNDYQKDRSTQVFILCDKAKDANLILVSFRGTEPFDADDWCTDFDYSWYEIPKLGKVHMGFLEALGLGNRADPETFKKSVQLECVINNYPEGTLSSLSRNDSDERIGQQESSAPQDSDINDGQQRIPDLVEMTAYYTVLSKLKSLLKVHSNAKFVVTGHSLGGALAVLFPTVLVLREEKELMQRLLGVYTYGQPRVGDRNLGRFMQSHLEHPVPKYFRVVYCNDLVPRLPYDDQTFLYKHFGVCLYYNSLYIDQEVDEEPNRNFYALQYLFPAYMNAAWELIRSFIMGNVYGPEYKEGWLSVLIRIVGLAFPGISAHSPLDYVNSARLGREKRK